MSEELPRAFGAYTLLKQLARGGMGEIYLARTVGITGFEKYYAVKKLLQKFTYDNDVGARFIDEAKLGARLQHPNIVQVYDLGRVLEELYIATEFVDGFDLRRVLRFCHEKKKRIPLDIALFIVREILSGLAYAHRQVDGEGRSIDLIHRDISPQNVLVSFEGEVKIIDFGLAKSTQRSQETQANVLLGNFGYMSPEQARGLPLDVRTDVYAAGIVLFELVTGTKRFVEDNPLRLLEMVARPTPIVPSDRVTGTPRVIDTIYATATTATLEERYQHAEAFRDDITAALYRINPRASRENLAQFLNHLFLGGTAPIPVDSDALNDKSVAIRARDLHETSDAFRIRSQGDLSDRRLHEFSDEAPSTSSLPLMRHARAGETLTHQQLTGEELPAPPVPSAPQASPPVLDIDTVGDSAQLLVIVGAPSSDRPPVLSDQPACPEEMAAVPSASADAEADVSGELQAQIEVQLAQADLQRQIEAQLEAQLEVQQQLEQQLAEQTGAPQATWPPPSSRANTTVMTTLEPTPQRGNMRDEASEPSIVLSSGLEPAEATVVSGASLADGDQMLRAQAPAAVSEDGGAESWAIEIASDAGAPASASFDGDAKNIRPAAQPMGKRVVPGVAPPSPTRRRP